MLEVVRDPRDFLSQMNARTREFGPVAYGSSDLTRPIAGYQKQSQFAVGGLIGYDFGPLTLQTYITTEVSESNYGGRDTRGWARLILPLGNLFAQPAPAPIVRKD